MGRARWLLLLPGLCTAQSLPPVDQILSRVGETYRNLKSYSFELRETRRGTGPDVVLAAVPGKFYAEAVGPFVYQNLTDAGYDYNTFKESVGIRCIADGQFTWAYNSRTRRYSKKGAAPFDPARIGTQDICERNIAAVRIAIVERWKGIGNWAHYARIAREASFRLGKSDIKCWVVEIDVAEKGERFELWIDQSRYLVLREQYPGKSTRPTLRRDLVEADISKPPDAKLFEFLPPPRSRQVDSVAMVVPTRPFSEFIGYPAPDFKFIDNNGGEASLSGLKGKVVILYFWSTRTPESEARVTAIEKLWRVREPAGVALVGISEEAAGLVRNFLEKHKAGFPNYSDVTRELHALYGVQLLPTVIVVDREGLIRAYLSRDDNPKDVVDALDAIP